MERVVCPLIDYDIRHHSGQNVVPCESTTNFDLCDMANVIVNKRTDNAEPRLICFLPQYSMSKKRFISEHDQDHDTKKEQVLSVTVLQSDWFISQNEHS